MENMNYSFIISGLAGLSTMIGTIVIFFNFKNIDKLIGATLSFAAGVMIMICLTDLIPAAFHIINHIYTTVPSILVVILFMIVGIIISSILNKTIPSNENSNEKNRLFRTGVLSMIVLILHNIPEGIATFVTSRDNFKFGVMLALAISFHNIPEGISIAVPIYYSTRSKTKSLLYTFVAGFSELIGALIAYLFLLPYINDYFFSFLYAIISGLMIYISVCELLPTSFHYANKKTVLFSILLGFGLMILCHYFI